MAFLQHTGSQSIRRRGAIMRAVRFFRIHRRTGTRNKKESPAIFMLFCSNCATKIPYMYRNSKSRIINLIYKTQRETHQRYFQINAILCNSDDLTGIFLSIFSDLRKQSKKGFLNHHHNDVLRTIHTYARRYRGLQFSVPQRRSMHCIPPLCSAQK